MEQEAACWVARRMSDEPFDEAGFDAWLAGDARRKPLFDTMWRRIMGPGMDDALSTYKDQRRRSRRAVLTGGAAAGLALIGGYQALPSIQLLLTEPRAYAVAAGDISEVTLQDGTRLTLAGGADVHVRYTHFGREVELTRGTIFADVVRDEGRPFHIRTGDAEVTVLGTRFEVSRKLSGTRVTVESGRVRFGSDDWFGSRVELAAHQTAARTRAGVSQVADIGDNEVARWRSEWVEYRDAPMAQVITDLEGVSPLPIRIFDKRLADLRVSGRIRLTDPMKQLENLSIIHDFTVHERQDVIALTSN